MPGTLFNIAQNGITTTKFISHQVCGLYPDALDNWCLRRILHIPYSLDGFCI